MADKIFDLSEVSGEEYQSAELLCSYLEKEGFEVERGTGFPTAFRAEWRNGSGGPVIGILVEYDALEKIGHACGHHLQGPADWCSNSSKRMYVRVSMHNCCVWNSGRRNSWWKDCDA